MTDEPISWKALKNLPALALNKEEAKEILANAYTTNSDAIPDGGKVKEGLTVREDGTRIIKHGHLHITSTPLAVTNALANAVGGAVTNAEIAESKLFEILSKRRKELSGISDSDAQRNPNPGMMDILRHVIADDGRNGGAEIFNGAVYIDEFHHSFDVEKMQQIALGINSAPGQFREK